MTTENNVSRIETIRQQYNDIVQQNSNISTEISRSIKMENLGEETTEMVTSAMLEIESATKSKTMGEKMIALLPAPIENRLNKGVAAVERAKLKNSNIAAVATKHFDLLSDRRDSVKQNIMSLYSIHEKLNQSRALLTGLSGELQESMAELEGDNTMQAKKDILTGKELSVQVESQIAVQNDLINQLEMVDFTAGVVLDTINQTLPDIKANFIDQISISTSLENLKNFKDSVDATRKMTITLQEETFENTQEIMLSIAEQGVGLQEADLVRMEKLAEKKAALGKKVSTKLIDNSRQLDEHLVRIKDMNAKNVSSFDHMAIQDLSPSSTTKLAEEKKAKKEEPVVMGGVKDIEMPESDIIDVEVS